MLPDVIRRMDDRLRREVRPAEATDIWTSTLLLLGLRFEVESIERAMQGVPGMEESVTYQAIIRKGEAKAARTILLMVGEKRFGPPDAETRATIEAITSWEYLHHMIDRLSDARSWDDLLAAEAKR